MFSDEFHLCSYFSGVIVLVLHLLQDTSLQGRPLFCRTKECSDMPARRSGIHRSSGRMAQVENPSRKRPVFLITSWTRRWYARYSRISGLGYPASPGRRCFKVLKGLTSHCNTFLTSPSSGGLLLKYPGRVGEVRNPDTQRLNHR